jgi:CHASE2 domain-containing sensor protein
MAGSRDGAARAETSAKAPRGRPSEPTGSLAAAIRENLPAVVLISLAVFAAELLGWLSWLERDALDIFLRARPVRFSERIYLVEVNEDDYRTVFGARSPLDPDALKRVLTKIEAAKPAVIGVDLDTSDAQFNRTGWPAAVWARDAEPVCQARPGEETTERQCEETDRITRLPVLGGRVAESRSRGGEIETEPRSGIVLFPRDRDGVIRRYQHSFESDSAVPPSRLAGRVDSFQRAVVKAFNQAVGRAGGTPAEPRGEHLVLNFTGDRYEFRRVSLGQVLQGADQPYWKDRSPLRGRIVLLGGTYRAARDEYFTPVGTKFGVEIIAQAVESELAGGGIRPVNHATGLAFDVAAGLTLVCLNWWLFRRLAERPPAHLAAGQAPAAGQPPGQTSDSPAATAIGPASGGEAPAAPRHPRPIGSARWLSVLVIDVIFALDILFIAAASLVGSYISFRSFGHWLNFTVVLVSVLVHILIERSHHVRKTVHHLEAERDEAHRQLQWYRERYGPATEPSGTPG